MASAIVSTPGERAGGAYWDVRFVIADPVSIEGPVVVVFLKNTAATVLKLRTASATVHEYGYDIAQVLRARDEEYPPKFS